MRAYLLSILLLTAVAFSFATLLEPWHQSWEGGRAQSENLIQVALGDSRQLFARHFFLKADAYFHNGYYPTIYDRKEGYGQAHIAEQRGGQEEKSIDFLGQPLDWLDAFSRSFFPSRHTHLGDSGHDPDHEDGPSHAAPASGSEHHHEHSEACDHDHDHDHDADGAEPGMGRADEREILPWLKLALELDPKRVQTYVVAAYWLRTTLKQADQAERVLRDGLRQVPGDPEMLFELGRILAEERSDPARARNVWELALKNWNEREAGRESPNFFIVAQILGNLATLEERAGRQDVAIRHLERLLAISPNKDSIAKWIESLREPKAP